VFGYTLTPNSTYIQRYRWFTHFPVHNCTCTRTYLSPLVVSQHGSQHRNYNSLIKSHIPNITHKIFTSQMYSSQITPRTNLNCEILTAAIILSHSTENCSHEVFNSHDQIFSNYEPFAAVCYRELTRKRASVSPVKPLSDKREMFQLFRHCWNAWRHRWHGHVTLPRSCVIQVFIAVAWQQTRRGDARLVTNKTPLRLLLRNRGSKKGWGLCAHPMPINGRPIAARVRFRWNMFTESLPSNIYTRHDIYIYLFIQSFLSMVCFKTSVAPKIWS
jgi:hypothetical protein